MSDIQRFKAALITGTHQNENPEKLLRYKDGEWVKHSDHQKAIEDKCEEIRQLIKMVENQAETIEDKDKEIDDFKRCTEILNNQVDELQIDVEQWKQSSSQWERVCRDRISEKSEQSKEISHLKGEIKKLADCLNMAMKIKPSDELTDDQFNLIGAVAGYLE